jgi:hypothetical protein
MNVFPLTPKGEYLWKYWKIQARMLHTSKASPLEGSLDYP